jgi:Trypsin
MRKLLSIMVVVMAVFATTAAPAGAITWNYVKDFEHPFVGLAVFYDANGEFLHRCSGSLLTPTVFLTAGHCVEIDGPTSARVYFQQDAGAHYDPATELDPVTGYPDYCAAGTENLCTTSHQLYNYGFPAGFPNTKDVGLLILDSPINVAEYGVLARAGFLDDLATRRGKQAITFTDSGYGLSYTNPHVSLSFRERLMAQSQLVNLRSALTNGFNLQTTNNPGIGGGTCFGDSGGPIFVSGTTTLVAVVSFGTSSTCSGTSGAYRLDQADDLAFLATFGITL